MNNILVPLLVRFAAMCFGVYVLYLGLPIVVGLAIVGGMGGNSTTSLVTVISIYVLTTGLVSLWCALAPRPILVAILLFLALPVTWLQGYIAHSTFSEQGMVQIYLHSEDPQQVLDAKHRLEALGQRAGERAATPPAVKELLQELPRASNDASRIKIVNLLGMLSYQHKGVLQALQALYGETASDPQRQLLHQATGEALIKVNPYAKLPNFRQQLGFRKRAE